MIAVAGLIEGEHDFTSFAAADPEKGLEDEDRSKVRTIFPPLGVAKATS